MQQRRQMAGQQQQLVLAGVMQQQRERPQTQTAMKKVRHTQCFVNDKKLAFEM
jgi:hypothetical protein